MSSGFSGTISEMFRISMWFGGVCLEGLIPYTCYKQQQEPLWVMHSVGLKWTEVTQDFYFQVRPLFPTALS